MIEDGLDVRSRQESKGRFDQGSSGITFGHWTSNVADELWAPDFSRRTICIQLRSIPVAIWLDGKETSHDEIAAGSWLAHASGNSFRAVTPTGYDLLRLEFEESTLRRVLTQLGLHRPPTSVEFLNSQEASDDLILAVSSRLKSLSGTRYELPRLELDHCLDFLMGRFLLSHSNISSADAQQVRIAKGGLAPWQVNRAREFLTEHRADEIRLGDVANVVGLSTYHFARMFKRSTGFAPFEYQRRLRCEQAKHLLIATDLTVTDIAATVGYETPQAFARMFRVEVGMTPTAWRRERRS